MKLALFGVTGPSGAILIEEALKENHALRIYARSPGKFPQSLQSDSSVEIIEGTLEQSDKIKQTIEGCDAVLSILSPTPGQDEYAITNGIEVIFSAMRDKSVRRFIGSGTASVHDPADKKAIGTKFLVSLIKVFRNTLYRDIVAYGDVLKQTNDIDWSWLRIVLVTNGPSSNGKVLFGPLGDQQSKAFPSVTRKDLAWALLHELNHSEYVKQMPVIQSAP
ncbi:hypothetical protein NQZ79_g6250 [Umbelopsis isabellina]|nr:hypothetical protein NQZ79_g6250 [Umbelopsis isabellina]